MAEYYFTVWIDHILFIGLVADGHLGCFSLAVVKNASVSICVQIIVWTKMAISLEYIPGSRLARS